MRTSYSKALLCQLVIIDKIIIKTKNLKHYVEIQPPIIISLDSQPF